MADDEPRRWSHRSGDQYVPIAASIVGNPEAGYWTEYVWYGDTHRTLAQAQRAGFNLDRSDDFNIGVIRGGYLAALTWMGEITDDGFDVLSEIAEQTDLPAPASSVPDSDRGGVR